MEFILISNLIIYILFYFKSKKYNNLKIKYILSLVMSYLPFVLFYLIFEIVGLFEGKEFDVLFLFQLNFFHIIIKIIHSLYFNIFIDFSKKWYMHVIKAIILILLILNCYFFMNTHPETSSYYYLCYCGFYVLIVVEFFLSFYKNNKL